MKRFLKHLIPDHAIIPLALTFLSLMVSYQGAKLVQAIFGMPYVLDLTVSWDSYFPFRPSWVLVYVGSYLFWCYVYILPAREAPGLGSQLAVADCFGKALCMIFFLALPTTNVRPPITGTSLLDQAMGLIYSMDTATNLFPSEHCFMAYLGTRFVFRCKELKKPLLHRLCSAVGCALVFLSTLYTKQHVIVDVFGAVAVAELSILFADRSKLTSKLCDTCQSFRFWK